jgi:multidrug efflux pump subunit AcrB
MDTAVPRLLAMLCILAVFIPSFFMQGAAARCSCPLSLAVGFAMISSYLLSSTFVPVLSPGCSATITGGTRPAAVALRRPRPLRQGPSGSSAALAGRPAYWPPPLLGAFVDGLGSAGDLPAGRCRAVPAPHQGADRDADRTDRADRDRRAAAIGEEVGPEAVDISVGYVGNIPSSYPINAIYQWTGGPEEAVLRVALKPGADVAIGPLKERLRATLAGRMPGVRFSFEPADIVSEVMSFGSPTPVEVAVNGPNLAENRAFAETLRDELAAVPSLRDLQFGQPMDYPTVNVELDRERVGSSGVTVAEVSRSLVAATSSSRFIVPNYWPDPKTGIGYQVQVEIPTAVMDSIGQVETIPISIPGGPSLLLRDVARVSPARCPARTTATT